MKIVKVTVVIILMLFFTLIGYLKIAKINSNEFGLSVLTLLKHVAGQSVDLNELNQTETKIIDHEIWTNLLQKHVDRLGKVNYQGFAKDQVKLSTYLNELSENPPGSSWTKDEKITYWINAYNAFTVQLILDHYPVHSIKEIAKGVPMINSPWDLKFFKIGGVDFDLNTIEHEILRKQFNEPRIHFSINCASVSCPILRNEAYRAKDLNEQLNDQTDIFINDRSRNIINKNETKISKIFSWFESDFGSKANVLLFIKQYNRELEIENKIEYLDYNWNLND